MREETGDIWDYRGRAVIALTTNGSVGKGRAVVGRGVARQALVHFPDLPEVLGKLIAEHGNHVHILGDGFVSFPVEESAWEWPDPRLIERSARELRKLADHEGWELVVVPRPGCGGGGLKWQDVRPLVEPWFDDRFVVIVAS